MSSSEVRSGVIWTIGVVTPFVLRSVVDFILSQTRERCARQCCGERGTKELLLGTGVKELAIDAIMFEEVDSFNEASELMAMPKCSIKILAVMRLLFWHLMQPCLYFIVFYAYWPLLDVYQRVLGSMVAVRELYYAVVCLIGWFMKPVYLLPDFQATLQHSELVGLLLCYIFAPEKYVTVVVSSMNCDRTCLCCDRYENSIILSFCMILVVLDLSAVGALIAAIIADRMYVPMMIGYCVTASGLVSFCLITILVAWAADA